MSDVISQIVDILTGKECVGEEHGEICVSGPQVMLGYLNKPEATANMIKPDGWMHTGRFDHCNLLLLV